MEYKKKIIITVTNDLVTDQRMQRICNTLSQNGYDVLFIGRILNTSHNVNFNYKYKRISCIFNKGKLFYIEYNLRLFLYLLINKCDANYAVDLDTIIPNYLVSKICNQKLIYDAHEWFCEVPEVSNRPFIKRIWQIIENKFVNKNTIAMTVNESLATIFKEKLKTNFEVVRNVPYYNKKHSKVITEQKYILYQGAINEGRGIESLIDISKHIDMPIKIAGNGDLYEQIKEQIHSLKLQEKVELLGVLEPEKLNEITQNAYIGYNVLEKKGLSYYYSLSNKTFDYIASGLPQIMSNFPEYTKLNSEFNIGLLTDYSLNDIEMNLKLLINDHILYKKLKENTIFAHTKLNWTIEEKILLNFFNAKI